MPPTTAETIVWIKETLDALADDILAGPREWQTPEVCQELAKFIDMIFCIDADAVLLAWANERVNFANDPEMSGEEELAKMDLARANAIRCFAQTLREIHTKEAVILEALDTSEHITKSV